MYHIDKAHHFSVLEGHIPLKAQTASTRHEGGVIKGMKLTWQLTWQRKQIKQPATI